EDNNSLDEVVVVGYGVQKKKLVTGATVQVKGEDIAKLNTTNALTAMQSSTPGVQITQASAQPGKGFKVNIRGIGTIGESSPLLVIDGIQSGTADNGLNGLNPSDIESIDVLKDAASAAIYGARAANGVILVTTKQGKAGKLQLSYDGFVGWSNPYKRPATLGAKDYINIVNESYFNTYNTLPNWSSIVPQSILDRVEAGWDGTDWFDEYRNKNALQSNHSLSLIGGSDRSKFSMSINRSSNDGIMGGDQASSFQRYSGRINSEHIVLKGKTHDIITIGENISYWYHKSHELAEDGGYWNIMQPTYTTSPLVPAYAEDGSLFDYANHGSGFSGQLFSNPLAALQGGAYSGINRERTFGVGATFYWIVEPIKGLRYRGSVNTGYSSTDRREFARPFSSSQTNANANWTTMQRQNNSASIQIENTISYQLPELLKGHSFDIMVGQSTEKTSWGSTLEVKATVADGQQKSMLKNFDYAWIDNYAIGNVMGIQGFPADDWSLASFFGRLNWNYDEKYMATVTVRTEGSSNFARGHRWCTFPSVSAGWVITNEKFMEKTRSWMDFLKIRASWGQNGNCKIDNFQYLSTIAYSPTAYADYAYKFGSSNDLTLATSGYKTGAYADIMPNEDVTWETSEQLNLGLDARFLNGRLGVNFDWYRKTTKDWLVQAPILAIYGLPASGAPYINGGDVRNTGVELALSWNDRIGKDFKYHANFNLATNKNEVTRLATEGKRIDAINSNGNPNPEVFENATYMARVEVGHPIGYFYGMSYSGVWQNQEQIDAARAAGKAVLADAKPGDLIWDDNDGSGDIDYNLDRHEIGSPIPTLTLGASLGFDYKGFDFNITGSGQFGHKIFQVYRTALLANPYLNYTQDVFERWHGDGTSNTQPRLEVGSNNDKWISSRYLSKGDYFRIQNVTIGYDFNRLWKGSPFQQLRLYAQAQNLITFTGYTGVDPEVGRGGGGESWVRGVDLGLYPTARTYIVGVNIKF
ncbi:MAG: TonB-dependent receptor, partial [Prevotella sp.]|nr:TonB-dependent receptor [Prevotella sp.]